MRRPSTKPRPRYRAIGILVLGLTGCVTPLGAPRLSVPPSEDPGVFPAPREEVAVALTAVLDEEGFQVVADERPGLGSWRLLARSKAEQRFISMVGLRGRVQEIEASLSHTSEARTRVTLGGRLWVYAGDPPAPGSADSASATSSEWTDAERFDALLSHLWERLRRSP